MHQVQFISEDRMQKLEETISWLSNLKPVTNVTFQVGNSIKINDCHLDKTLAINELASLNKRREELINLLMK